MTGYQFVGYQYSAHPILITVLSSWSMKIVSTYYRPPYHNYLKRKLCFIQKVEVGAGSGSNHTVKFSSGHLRLRLQPKKLSFEWPQPKKLSFEWLQLKTLSFEWLQPKKFSFEWLQPKKLSFEWLQLRNTHYTVYSTPTLLLTLFKVSSIFILTKSSMCLNWLFFH